MINLRKLSLLALFCFAFISSSARAALSATEVVDRAETVLWGKTIQGDIEMIVKTPSWSKTFAIKLWVDRPLKAFTRITAPAKEAGITSLRLALEMWNYIPSIERTIKIPPSMMLQPWFGSDFTNDDVLRESSNVNDYTHKIFAESNMDGHEVYEIEGLPKPNAAVVWGKVIFTIRKGDFIPIKTAYYDEHGELVRILTYSDVRMLNGRTIPTRWEMQPLNKPGKSSLIIVKSAIYDKVINPDLFSLRNLTQKE
jgi:outer membrane lipoprotein-sorting protein